jgi:hypothetical protein
MFEGMNWFKRFFGMLDKEVSVDAPGRGQDVPVQERRAEPDPEALAAAVRPPRPIGLDLDRLKELPSSAYKPLTEYLTYIQVKRGENQSLVFVRQRDLEALAAMTGESKENFVKEFKRLGVLLSMN